MVGCLAKMPQIVKLVERWIQHSLFATIPALCWLRVCVVEDKSDRRFAAVYEDKCRSAAMLRLICHLVGRPVSSPLCQKTALIPCSSHLGGFFGRAFS
jgi:hypothetical protein